MSALSKVGEYVNNIIWAVGLMTIYQFVGERWPATYAVFAWTLVPVCAIGFFWLFFAKPFMAGMRGEDELPEKLGRRTDGAGM
jgi:hypothetical protein